LPGKIIVAPDAFKECLDVFAVTEAIVRGLVCGGAQEQQIVSCPLADGGEGLLDVLVHTSGGSMREVMVTGPLGKATAASFALLEEGKTAVVEMAQAAGIHLIDPSERNPRITTTFGVGELMRHALDAGVRRIIVGLGGSVTNDGGAGMAQALGVSFKDEEGCELPFGGEALLSLASLDCSGMDPRLKDVEIIGACDVSNPLCGNNGATAVYGPQKGATEEDVVLLDRALNHYGKCLEVLFPSFRRDTPGVGAAGGLGAGLAAFTGASLRSGVELVLDSHEDLEEQWAEAEVIITGEGRVDGQSMQGKVISGVAEMARRYEKPLFVLCGKMSGDMAPLYAGGVTAVFPIAPAPMSEEEAMRNASAYLSRTAENLMRTLLRLKGGEG
jgi:glycerate kinase